MGPSPSVMPEARGPDRVSPQSESCHTSDVTLPAPQDQGHHSMTRYALLLRWSGPVTLAIGLTIPFVGCAKVPRQYVQMANRVRR